MRAAGFVLVGGRSSRMGRDKALLQWNSEFLVQHVAAKVACVAGTVALVGGPERYSQLGYRCLPDLRPGHLGPLAGIEAALDSRGAEFNLIVACDMPSIKIEWLHRLLGTALETGALCVATRDTTGALHPLCAVYRTGCLTKVQDAFSAGQLKLLQLLKELNAQFVEIPGILWNMNTAAEWTEWENTALQHE